MLRSVRSMIAAAAVLASAASAFGQSSILQGGSWTAGRSPMYVGSAGSQPIVQDSGPASGGAIGLGLAEQLLTVRSPTNTYPAANAGTGQLGANWCDYDAPTTNATGYHYLCMSPNAQGGGLIAFGFGGGATALPFYLNVNGTAYQFPFTVGGIVGPGSTVVNDFVLWNNTTGTLVKDGGAQISTAQIADSAVTTIKIAALAVDNSKLAANSVATGNIQAGAVGTTQIANAAVGTTQMANNSVTTAIIAAGAVGQSDLAADATFWRTATVNDSVLTTDCWKTLGYGGNAFFTVTLPSVAGFPAGCKVQIVNTDVFAGAGTGRGKKLAGFPGVQFTILYPQQSLEVQIINGAWVLTLPSGPWFLPTSAEICVAQNGVDTNDGLGSGTDCMQTIQGAVNVITQNWQNRGTSGCAIGLYVGGTSIFNEAVSYGPLPCVGITFNFRGAVTWQSTTYCLSIGDGPIAIINANLGPVPIFKCNSANTASQGAFYLHQNVIMDITGTLQWVPGGNNDNFIFADAQGRATLDMRPSPGLIVGDGAVRSAFSILDCDSHCSGIQIGGFIGFSANVTLGQTFVAHTQSYINTTAAYVGAPFAVGAASTPTGNSVLITNGTAIPGGTAAATGGQVCAAKC